MSDTDERGSDTRGEGGRLGSVFAHDGQGGRGEKCQGAGGGYIESGDGWMSAGQRKMGEGHTFTTEILSYSTPQYC